MQQGQKSQGSLKGKGNKQMKKNLNCSETFLSLRKG